MAEGGGGVEGGCLVGRAEAGDDTDQGRDAQSERGRRVGDDGSLVGEVGQGDRDGQAGGDPEQAADGAEDGRLGEELGDDVASAGPDGPADADLADAFADHDQHHVGHADTADDEADGGDGGDQAGEVGGGGLAGLDQGGRVEGDEVVVVVGGELMAGP